MAGLAVIGYDGSRDAQRAVDFAARALRAEAALVVCVWSIPVMSTQAAAPLGAAPPPAERDEHALEQAALRTADDGAARARNAGLVAEAVVRRGASPEEIASALYDVADERDARIVVVGRRGMSRVKEVVLGSVSNAAMHDGRRPLLVVPGPRD